jgi:hypothetical protein
VDGLGKVSCAVRAAAELGEDLPVLELRVLCVPKMSSTSCDLRVFMEDATEAITAPDLELI